MLACSLLMTAKLRFFWARLNANYWFFPGLFAVLAALLATAMVALDHAGVADALDLERWIVPIRPTGAADFLSVMASATIGVASTVFSITLVAVTYASGTYGPRLLTNFLEDKGNQISLATFIAAFVYALIVLRSVRAEDEGALGTLAGGSAAEGFAPQLSILVAYLLMAACVAVLVFFLNHVPTSIGINNVLRKIGKRLIKEVEETYPDAAGTAEAPGTAGGEPLLSGETGYVQLIDFEGLAKVAGECDAILSLKVRTGDFVHRDLPLLEVRGAPPEELAGKVRPCFTTGSSRTPAQDPQFLIDELVEIGLRALSPGVNDPFTAITALHWLGAATAEIGRRDLRKQVGGAEHGAARVIPLAADFAHFCERGFGSIRSAVAASPNAVMVMLDALANAATPLADPQRRAVLRGHGDLLIEQARSALTGPDLAKVEQAYRQFARALA